MENQQTLSSLVFAKGLEICRSRCKPLLLLAFFGLMVPELIVALYSDASAIKLSSLIKDTAQSQVDFNHIWLKATSFYGSFFGLVVLSWFLAIATYFAAVRLCIDYLRSDIPTNWLSLFKAGLRDTMPRGIPIFILYFVLISSQNATSLFSLFLSTMALMAPVLIIVERRKGFAAIWHAVSLKYTREASFNVWNIMLSLFFFGSIAYAVIILSEYASDYILDLDIVLGLPKSLWMLSFGDTPIRVIYVFTLFARAVCSAFAIIAAAIISTSLYFSIHKSKVEVSV